MILSTPPCLVAILEFIFRTMRTTKLPMHPHQPDYEKNNERVTPPAEERDAQLLYPTLPLANAHWAKRGRFNHHDHQHPVCVGAAHQHTRWQAAHKRGTLAISQPPPSPTENLTSQYARQCQLTHALLLWGFSLRFGGIPTHGLYTPGFWQNPYPYPSKPVPLGTGTGFLGYGCG